MEIDKETEKQIQELQLLEQNLQTILMQKQAFQLELSEVENSLREVQKTKSEIFKITGQIMVQASKEDVEKELKEKKDLLSMRLKSFEEQEQVLSKQTEATRKKVLSKIQK